MRPAASILQFRNEETGTIAVLIGMSLVAFLAIIALVYDIGRMSSGQSDLQSFADNVALAAAGELDGQADALVRARNAAEDFVSDTVVFGSGDRSLSGASDYSLTFHEGLPDSDLSPMGTPTADPRDAYFAYVVVQPKSVRFPFASAAASLLSGGTATRSANISAEAVAGMTQDACDVSPLMFCLPPGPFSADPTDPGNVLGTMINLRSGGSGSSWGPGNFGFLDLTNADLGSTCEGKSGGPLLACMVAAERGARKCYSQNNLTTETGQKVGIEDAAFNVRFDIYQATMSKADYPPAPNVLKGIVPKGGSSCIKGDEEPSPDTMALPRDDCFAAGCTGGRFGDGDWSNGRDLYYETNFDVVTAGSSYADFLGYAASLAGGAFVAPITPPGLGGTRYEQYLAEVALADASGGQITPLDRSETGLPQCNTSDVAVNGARRRVVVAAGVRCGTGPGEYDIRGKTTGVRAEAFYEVFLTEPVGSDGSSPPNFDIWGEIIGSAGGDGYSAAGTGGIFRDVVQIYR